MHYLKSATASRAESCTPITFEITHPFHPKRGARLVLVTRKMTWGEDRVMFFDPQGRLCSIAASWTSLAERDAFAQASAGRSWFRIDDLLKLRALIDELRGTSSSGRGVKLITPHV